jgi:hypothetical protein
MLRKMWVMDRLNKGGLIICIFIENWYESHLGNVSRWALKIVVGAREQGTLRPFDTLRASQAQRIAGNGEHRREF